MQARSISLLRHSRTMSPEDFIFLVRYDRAKVNRLRTYLSWKEVRKNAKEDGGGAGDVDLANVGADDADMAKAQGGISRKLKVKLPWEISSVYTDYVVPGAGSSSAAKASSSAEGAAAAGKAGDDIEGKVSDAAAGAAAMDEELDEDDEEAMRDSLKRLKEADEATLKMTREEYEHYADCRTASFTFRKAKKFREFIASSNYLDVKPNDDIVDILGFLAFEVVREITLGAKYAWEQERKEQLKMKKAEAAKAGGQDKKRKRNGSGSQQSAEGSSSGSSRERAKKGDGSKELKRENTLSSTRSDKDPEAATRGRSPGPSSKKRPRSSDGSDDRSGQGDDDGKGKAAGDSDEPEVDFEKLYPHGPFGGASGSDETSTFCGLFGLAPVPTIGEVKPAPPAKPKVVEKADEKADADKTDGDKPESQSQDSGDKGNERTADSDARTADDEEVEETPVLLPHHIREAFARLQRDKTTPMLSTGTVVGGPIGGLRRSRQLVI